MVHKVTVTRTSGTADGWLVQCFHWRSKRDPNPQRRPLIFTQSPNQPDTYEANVDLKAGIYSLVCELTLGVAVDIDLTPAEPIFQSDDGSNWPVSFSVPTTRTRDIFTVYFRIPAQAEAGQ